MKHTILTIITLLGMTTTVMAEEGDVLLVKSGSEITELQLSNEPTMTIGETITVTDGTTTKSFNANQRIVLTAVSTPTITTDLNGDGKFNMKDVQYLFDKYMEE